MFHSCTPLSFHVRYTANFGDPKAPMAVLLLFNLLSTTSFGFWRVLLPLKNSQWDFTKKIEFYENPDFLWNPTASSFAAKKLAKIQNKSSITAWIANEQPLVLLDRQNSLSNVRKKGEGYMCETFVFLVIS